MWKSIDAAPTNTGIKSQIALEYDDVLDALRAGKISKREAAKRLNMPDSTFRGWYARLAQPKIDPVSEYVGAEHGVDLTALRDDLLNLRRENASLKTLLVQAWKESA